MLSLIIGKITNNLEAKMHWKNYEEHIVDEHGVVLESWPNEIFNLNDLRLWDLKVILAALTTGKCYWRKLDEKEHELHEWQYIERLVNNKIPSWKQKKGVMQERNKASILPIQSIPTTSPARILARMKMRTGILPTRKSNFKGKSRPTM